MLKYYTFLKNNPFVSLLSGSILAQVITLLSMPLITRLFSLEEMGQISVFINFITIQSALALFKFENAILLYKDIQDSRPLWVIFIYSMTIISIFSVFVFLLFHHYQILGINELPLWSLVFIVLVIFGSGMAIILRVVFVRERDFKILSKSIIIKNLLNVFTRIVGGVLGGGLFSLLLAEVICFYYFILQLFKFKFKKIFSGINLVSKQDIFNTIYKWKKFPLIESPSILLDQLNSVLPLLLIAQNLGASVAAIFALSFRISFLPGSHLGSTLSELFRGQFSEHYRNQDYNLVKDLFYRTIMKTILFSIIFYVPIYFFVPDLIPMIFGIKWAAASGLIKLIVPWAASAFIVSTLSPVFSVMQIQYLKLVYDISAIVLLFLFMRILPINNIIQITIAVVSSNFLANIIYFLLILISYRRLSKCVV